MNSIEPKTLEGDLKKITKEAGITFVGVLFGIGLRYICAVIIARHVGALSFGVYALGLTIINLAQIVAIAGLNYGVLRFVSAHYSANEGEKVKGFIISALKLVLIGSLCIGVFLFIGADILAEKVFSKNELGLIIKWFSLSLPFLAVIEISVFSIQGIQALRYKVYVKAIFQQLLQLGIVIVMFLVGLKVLGAVYAYLISALLASLLGFYYLRKLFPDIAKRAMKADSQYTSLLRFSIPVLGMNILGFGMMWTDTLMVGYFMTSRDVGVYNAAAKTAFLLHIVLFSFSAIFMPMISDLSNRGDLEKLKSLLGTVTKWIFALSFPMFLLMAILSKHIMAIFGSEFIVALPCFLILALAQLISSSAGPLGNVLIMSGKQDIVFLDTAISCSLNVILNYILIGKYGIVGAAIATGLSIAFLNCAYLVEVYYYYQIHPYNRKILKPILSGIMASLVGLVGHSLVGAANPLYLFPTVIFIFILCYVMFLYIWGFDDEDKVVSHALLRRFSSVLKAS
jgi:O-antigen/teichoic acid export membrane protein